MSISIVRSLQAFYQLMAETGEDSNSVCLKGYHITEFYYIMAVPSVIVYIIFSSFVKRRNFKPELFNSRFGLIYPMDIFSRQSRLPYCCAFGIATSAMYDLIIHKGFFYKDSFPLGTLKAIACIFLYCTVFLNMLSALTIRTACSFAVGTIFVWALSANRILESLICFTSKENTKSVFALRCCPVMVCHAYMAILMPWKCLQAIRRKEYVKVKKVNMFDTLDSIRESYQGQHVRKLLKHPVQLIIDSSQPKVDMTQQRLKTIYHGESGFKYPSKLLSVMFVSTIMIYLITIDIMAVIIPHLNNMLEKCLDTLESVGYIKIEGENPEITNIRDTIHMVFNLTQCIFYSFMVSIPMACVIMIILIFHSIVSFRTNIFSIYRGDFTNIPAPEIRSGHNLCVNSLKFAGYQVAYIVMGYLWMCTFLFFLFMCVITMILILIGGSMIWNRALHFISAMTLVAGMTHFLQKICVSVFLVQGDGRYLRLDNRRMYFFCAYYFFFFNMISGFVSCSVRILKAILMSFLAVAKMDISIFPRKFDFYDPGFSIYHGYIHLEASHSNPVLLVFISILVSLSKTRKLDKTSKTRHHISTVTTNFDAEFVSHTDMIIPEQKINAVFSAARFQWLVAYTLIQNPTIRIYRRGFIQLLNAAVKEGLKVPLSDRPIYFILTQIQNAHRNKKKKRLPSLKAKNAHRAGPHRSAGKKAIKRKQGTVYSEATSTNYTSTEFTEG